MPDPNLPEINADPPEIIDIGSGLHVNLHRPAGTMATAAAGAARILCFHGGGGVGGAPGMLDPFCRLLVAEGGIVAAAARYRTLNQDRARLPEMCADAAQALAWARSGLPGGGPLYVLGASFGGLLALDAVLADPDDVAGLILLNAVSDTGPGGYANRVVPPEDGPALSPLLRYAGHPVLTRLRCLMLHGTGDTVLPVEMSRRFAGLWPAGRCDLIEVPHAGHGFFNRPPHDVVTAAQVRGLVTGAAIERPAPAAARKPAEKPIPARRLPRGLFPQGATLVYGIGAQKAGTSWLFDQLSRSDHVHVGPAKEMHYFDALHIKGEGAHVAHRVAQLRDLTDALVPGFDPANRARLRMIRLLADRLAVYATAAGDHRPYLEAMLRGYAGQRVICDFTPAYGGLSREGFADMNSLGPAKFIFVLRDPVARMWSQIRMAIEQGPGAESDAAFEARCVARATILASTGKMARIHRADYIRTMTALEAAVPAAAIHYVFYEDLFNQASMDRICDFLGIPMIQIEAGKLVNLGRETRLSPIVERLILNALRPQYTAAAARFGAALPEAWRRRAALPDPTPEEMAAAAAASPADTAADTVADTATDTAADTATDTATDTAADARAGSQKSWVAGLLTGRRP